MQKRSKIQQPKCFIYCNGLMDHVCKVHGVMCPNHPMSTAACADAACTNGAATASAAIREWYARPGHFNGTADAFVKIARNEGVASLWSGLPPTLWVYHWKMCPSHRCLSGKLWYLQHNCLWHFTLLILLEKVLEKVVKNDRISKYISYVSWNKFILSVNVSFIIAGLILGLHPAYERCHYKVTPSLIGWVQT